MAIVLMLHHPELKKVPFWNPSPDGDIQGTGIQNVHHAGRKVIRRLVLLLSSKRHI
jgi:hypothetical protein